MVFLPFPKNIFKSMIKVWHILDKICLLALAASLKQFITWSIQGCNSLGMADDSELARVQNFIRVYCVPKHRDAYSDKNCRTKMAI